MVLTIPGHVVKYLELLPDLRGQYRGLPPSPAGACLSPPGPERRPGTWKKLVLKEDINDNLDKVFSSTVLPGRQAEFTHVLQQDWGPEADKWEDDILQEAARENLNRQIFL